MLPLSSSVIHLTISQDDEEADIAWNFVFWHFKGVTSAVL